MKSVGDVRDHSSTVVHNEQDYRRSRVTNLTNEDVNLWQTFHSTFALLPRFRYDCVKFFVTFDMAVLNDDLISDYVLPGKDILCDENSRLIIEKNECRVEQIRQINTLGSLYEPINANFLKRELNTSDTSSTKTVLHQQHSFEILIKALINEPIFSLYDVNSQHEVHTDASSFGLAGVLLQ
ncbi:unnamed protein product [Ceratitis capitata]|uniref:(Mediterranean fruit fly) hypothetical protein n=1 Tax=Ceratitis capitata TaxID=7213 RepID=A0A811UWZ7_CERCA|nr:unnamed protein product [Ceratitis capitata]